MLAPDDDEELRDALMRIGDGEALEAVGEVLGFTREGVAVRIEEEESPLAHDAMDALESKGRGRAVTGPQETVAKVEGRALVEVVEDEVGLN